MGLIGGTQLATQAANIDLIKAQTENVKADTERKLGVDKKKVEAETGNLLAICNDERKKIIPIGCGKCMVCMKQRAREWKYRIIEDLKVYKNAKFITLTFKPEALKELNKQKIEKLNESTREREEINISDLKVMQKITQ